MNIVCPCSVNREEIQLDDVAEGSWRGIATGNGEVYDRGNSDVLVSYNRLVLSSWDMS